ncbi:hypothetical protein DdX_18290 [Ditylenchus destructor]|uniref:Uncharacterized protein n=1 Tax=Ditylenchus destructor TaxID=166010 RepID=A0AAD4MKH9_9BILA|nr:hypothetical protein DdX_18290 [Ditylenchus destructor]
MRSFYILLLLVAIWTPQCSVSKAMYSIFQSAEESRNWCGGCFEYPSCLEDPWCQLDKRKECCRTHD